MLLAVILKEKLEKALDGKKIDDLLLFYIIKMPWVLTKMQKKFMN